MLIVDFSQVVISNVVQDFKNDLKKGKTTKESTGMVRHMILNSILSYKRKFGKEYGEVVLAIDNRNYWRKKIFKYYKAHRARDREASDFDWELFYQVFDEIKRDLREVFPYKLVEVEAAEADDIIACLTKYLQTNETETGGLFSSGDPQKILIVSSDTDFVQLQKYKGVKQWSPMMKKFVGGDKDPKKYIIEHICTGDAGDGIPNIMSADNCVFDKVRQTGFKKARLEDFYEKGIDACANDTERARYQRNTMLIDFDCIPESIYTSIIEQYKAQVPQTNKAKILNYLMKNKMKLLIESAGDF